MTTLLDTLRYASGVYGEEAADLIEKQAQEIADHEKAYELLFAENAKLRAAVEADRAQRVPDANVSKELTRLADILRDCGRLVSSSGKAEDILRVAASMLASTPAQPAQQEPPPKECATPRACQYEGCRGNCHQEPPQPVERKPMTDLIEQTERKHAIRE